MRLAVVSDVHGNLLALDAVVAALERERPDVVVHGGDLALHGPRPAEVVDRVRELGWSGVIGNTDEVLWTGTVNVPEHLAAVFQVLGSLTCELLGRERVDWLHRHPPEWRSGDLALLHASPGDLWWAPEEEATDDELQRVYGGLGATTVVYGHIHVPYVRRLSRLTVANSGSVGLPCDGDWRASYLLVEDGDVSMRRVEYDLERELAVTRASRYPTRSWIEEVHRTARRVRPMRLDTC
jgi:putative phosphoesterase